MAIKKADETSIAVQIDWNNKPIVLVYTVDVVATTATTTKILIVELSN